MSEQVRGLSRKVALERVEARLAEVKERSTPSRLFFLVLESYRKSWALVGGAPRAWATGREDPIDLDVVVGGSGEDVEVVVEGWKSRLGPTFDAHVKRTKLGGYRLVAEGCMIDVWALPSTVGIAAGLLSDTNRYRAVARSAALSLDSLVLTSEGTLYDHGFFESFETGLLMLNHTRVVNQGQIAQKAVRLCDSFQLIPDFALESMIKEWQAAGDHSSSAGSGAGSVG